MGRLASAIVAAPELSLLFRTKRVAFLSAKSIKARNARL